MRDIRPGTANGVASYWFDGWARPVGNTVFFVGNDGIQGDELWKSDGTPAGTGIVADLTPAAASTPGQTVRPLVGAGSLLCFLVGSDQAALQLWRSDGTPEGTFAVRGPGPLTRLTGVGSLIYFWVGLGGTEELWRSDGTVEGTFALGATAVAPSSRILAGPGEVLFFAGLDPVHGEELWRSDGTTVGTTLVADIRPGPTGSEISNLYLSGGRVFFAANDGVSGVEFWKSDGTPGGTQLVRDLVPGSGGSFFQSLLDVAGRLYFGRNAHLDPTRPRSQSGRATEHQTAPCPGRHFRPSITSGFLCTF